MFTAKLSAGSVNIRTQCTPYRYGNTVGFENFGKVQKLFFLTLAVIGFGNGIDRNEVDMTQHSFDEL